MSATSSKASEFGAAGALPWSTDNETNGIAVFTLVLWLDCLLIGVLGFALHYARPHAPKPPDEPVLVQQLEVELTPDRVIPPDAEPPPSLAPPPPPDTLTAPVIAQPIAVAQPSPAVAFPLPVEGPTRIVEANQAEYARRPVATANAPVPAPQRLVLGEGEGKQPAPEYPAAAMRQGQEGTVMVRFTVGENGRVLNAEAVSPSPWPLLNEAALRAVRERWRFRRGPVRIYEVPIRFEMLK
jgi:protein TonB